MEWSEEMYATEPVLEKIEELENQLKEAREKNLRIIRGEFIQICSHCNFETKIGGWDELQKHIQECKGHPVYKLSAQLKEANEIIRLYDTLKGCGQVNTPEMSLQYLKKYKL